MTCVYRVDRPSKHVFVCAVAALGWTLSSVGLLQESIQAGDASEEEKQAHPPSS